MVRTEKVSKVKAKNFIMELEAGQFNEFKADKIYESATTTIYLLYHATEKWIVIVSKFILRPDDYVIEEYQLKRRFSTL